MLNIDVESYNKLLEVIDIKAQYIKTGKTTSAETEC